MARNPQISFRVRAKVLTEFRQAIAELTQRGATTNDGEAAGAAMLHWSRLQIPDRARALTTFRGVDLERVAELDTAEDAVETVRRVEAAAEALGEERPRRRARKTGEAG
jgi:hypothetical protein